MKLDRVTFQGFTYLAEVNFEFVLVLRAFSRKDNKGSHDVCSLGLTFDSWSTDQSALSSTTLC
jgi:hypothetical protein